VSAVPDTPIAGIGTPLRRLEDARLLSGSARYVDDWEVPGVAHMVVVRSAHAAARLVGIDTTAARAAPGVLAVLTGADLRDEGLGDIPCVSIPPAVMGGRWFRTPFPALAHGAVRCVGQEIAVVVAQTRAQALDAADSVTIDYAPHAASPTLEAALATDAPPVWSERPDNRCFVHELGQRGATDAAFARAHHVTKLRLRNQRLAGNPLEPRGCIGAFDSSEGRYRLITSTANPHRIRQLLAEHVLRVPAHRIHVVARDVGGGFGTKGGLYPEEVLALWAAKRLRRPVKWIADRSESFLADFNGRDQIADAEMAFAADGKILGFRVATYHNLGCQVGPSGAHPPLIGARMLSGVYAIPAMHVTVDGMLTHSRTLTTYRGAGRPEATFVVEHVLDRAADELGIDPVELRRRNLIAAAAMPYRTALGEVYDSGEFGDLMDAAQSLADWDGYAKRVAASAARGLRRGRGLAIYIEVCATVAERMEIRFDPTGDATIVAGTFSYGQGHETMYAQLVAEWLGLSPDRLRVVQGDTDQVAYGRGSFGSRTATVGGAALAIAAREIIAKGKRVAAHLLEAEAADIEFADGRFCVAGSDRAISLRDVAKATYVWGSRLPADLASGLEGIGHWSVSPATHPQNYPNGCYVAEVEVDPETGVVRLDRIAGVDDVGRVVNPLLLEGQQHGSFAQGAGQALLEQVLHDTAGQLVTGSFLDYALPRADDLPALCMDTRNVPTASNPLGVKGGAETGTVGLPPAIIAAIVDALRPLGVREVPMPATAERVWRAIRAATAPPS
jgi:carbon-monoxide dehydrogenase large subunit